MMVSDTSSGMLLGKPFTFFGNDRPVVRSGSSATPDLDTLPVPQNSHEAVERRDDEGAVREAESRTHPRLLL